MIDVSPMEKDVMIAMQWFRPRTKSASVSCARVLAYLFCYGCTVPYGGSGRLTRGLYCSSAVRLTLFPAPLFTLNVKRICETVPTPSRAAADRPSALGYMVWIGVQ